MSEWHPLTKRLIKVKVADRGSDFIETIVREWLEDKLKEMDVQTHIIETEWRRILCLSQPEEKKEVGVKESWCEHMKDCVIHFFDGKHYHVESEWQFCPICAAPRPKPVDLIEELAEVIHDRSGDGAKVTSYATGPESSREFYRSCAKAALSFLRERGLLKENI